MAKVVHFGKFASPHKGGIETVTRQAAIGATKAGYEVQIVCFEKGGAKNACDSALIEEFRTPVGLNVRSQPLSWSYFWQAIRLGRKSDLVHLHFPNVLACLAALFLASKTKLVVHWHSDILGKGLLAFCVGPFVQAVLWRANAIICTSQLYADGSPSLQLWKSKVNIVPIGIEDRSLRCKALQTALPQDLIKRVNGRKIVLSIGRLVPYKGFDVLIESAGLLGDEVVVIVAGAGPLERKLREQISKNGLEDKVIMLGSVSEKLLESLYTSAQLFCLPSINKAEAFGVVLVEAMAFGLPVIATTIPGSGVGWVNKAECSGLNVPVGAPVELAEACMSVIGDEAKHDFYAKGARHRYLEEFSESLFEKRIVETYESLGVY
jgi:glycosyltransferase involved in cell wall biosynthesis